MLRIKQLPTAPAVTKGQTSLLDMSLGERVHVIWLRFSDDGTASAGGNTGIAAVSRMCKEIRVKLSSTVVRTFTPDQLNQLNARNGARYACQTGGTAGTATYYVIVPIYLAEPWRNENKQQSMPAWNIVGVGNFQIEVQFSNDANSNAPALSGHYEYDSPIAAAIGSITKWISQSFAVAGLTTDVGPIDRKGFIQSINIFKDSVNGLVNQVRFVANGQQLREDVTDIQNFVTLNARSMTPDLTSRYDLEFDYDDPIQNALIADGLSSMTLKVTRSVATAANLPIIIQRVGTIND